MYNPIRSACFVQYKTLPQPGAQTPAPENQRSPDTMKAPSSSDWAGSDSQESGTPARWRERLRCRAGACLVAGKISAACQVSAGGTPTSRDHPGSSWVARRAPYVLRKPHRDRRGSEHETSPFVLWATNSTPQPHRSASVRSASTNVGRP